MRMLVVKKKEKKGDAGPSEWRSDKNISKKKKGFGFARHEKGRTI